MKLFFLFFTFISIKSIFLIYAIPPKEKKQKIEKDEVSSGNNSQNYENLNNQIIENFNMKKAKQKETNQFLNPHPIFSKNSKNIGEQSNKIEHSSENINSTAQIISLEEDVEHFNISDENIFKLMELENKNYDEYQKQVHGLSLIYGIKVHVIKYMLNERFKLLNKLFTQSTNKLIIQQTPFNKPPTYPQHNIEQSPHGIIEGSYQINNPMPLFNNQVSTPALANVHKSQHTENVGTSTSNQLKSVNYSIGDQTTPMNKNNYYIEDVKHLNISDEDIIKLMELKDKNFDEYQKQIYGLSLIYRIKVKVIKDIINHRFINLQLYKSPAFPHHNIEQSTYGNIEGNYQINNPMSLFDNQNLYRNNLISQQLNLNQFIGGNNHNTEINYLNNSIDSANNELMKVVESSKASNEKQKQKLPMGEEDSPNFYQYFDNSKNNLDQSDVFNNQSNFQNNVHKNTLPLFEHQNTKKTSKGKEPMKYL